MAQATKIADVLDVQGELTKVRGEIERLVAEKAHLEERAAFGTLTVTYNLPATPADQEVRRGWDPATDADRATGTLIGDRPGGRRRSRSGSAIVGLPLADRRRRSSSRSPGGSGGSSFDERVVEPGPSLIPAGQAADRGLPGDGEDPVDVEVVGDERLDELDLLVVGRVGLHEQVVDLGRDDVRVLRDDRREDVGLADRVEHGGARPVATGQDEPDRRALVARDDARRPSFVAAAAIAAIRAASAAPAVRSRRAKWAVVSVRITSSRSPGTMTSVPGPTRSSMWPGSIAPIATPSITRSRSGAGMDRLAVDALEDHREGRVREDRPDGQDAEERDAVDGEAALEDRGDAGLGVEIDLVDDRPGDLDAVDLPARAAASR